MAFKSVVGRVGKHGSKSLSFYFKVSVFKLNPNISRQSNITKKKSDNNQIIAWGSARVTDKGVRCKEDLTVLGSPVAEKIIPKKSEKDKQKFRTKRQPWARRFRSLHEGAEQGLGPHRIRMQKELHNLQGPVQNKNARPLVHKLLRVSTHWQQIYKPSVRPFCVWPHTSTPRKPVLWAMEMCINIRWQRDQTTLNTMYCFLKTNLWHMENLQDHEALQNN